jgi:hypothetical protein
MDQTLKDMLKNPDRWIGGEIHNYGHVPKVIPPNDRDAMLAEPGYPRMARIQLVQLEDHEEYFAVIGETMDKGPSFGCNGRAEEIRVTDRPTFPCARPGELAIVGPLVNGVRHEWHLIPKEA